MTRRVLPVALLLAAGFLYPAVVVALGTPRFPHRGECIRAAKPGEPIEAVFGHFRDRAAASQQLRRVLAVGFEGSKIVMNDCGVLKVVVQGIPTLAVGRDVQREARTVNLHPTLEQGMP